MAQWVQGDIQANGIKIHYWRTGGDKPPLVLAHGFTDHGLCWNRVAKALEDTHDLIMLDSRGHGLSERIHQTYSIDDLANDVLGAIDALKLARPGVFGHSMGASTAALAAMIAPEKIGYLLLEDPPWFEVLPPRDEPDSVMNPYEKHLLDLRTKSFDEALTIASAGNPKWHADEMTAWVESKMQLDMRVFHDMERSPRYVDWHEVAPHLQCPGLLLTADPNLGALVTPKTAREIESTWKQGQWAQIADAGHCIHRDQFEEAMRTVKAFLGEQRG
jgi:pimeloyl-ACP methyl ester carboxylesterase